jgi:phosphosulfolactate synthase (CoM biosynthesis protein A)
MIESEGITENVNTWRTDVVSQIMKDLPQEKVMFEGTFAQIISSVFLYLNSNTPFLGANSELPDPPPLSKS